MSKNVVCFGEVLLRLSAPGKQLLLQTGSFDVHVGGAEANVAVALSRLGHASAMVTSLPENALGHACADELRRHGVDIRDIQFRAGRMGLYFLTHGAGQRPAEVLYDRAGSAFAVSLSDSFDWQALLANTEWLHLSGITPAVGADSAAAALRAMRCARECKVKVSFDCNFRARLWDARAAEAPRILRELCGQADLIFGDDRDVAFMLGNPGEGAPSKRRRDAATLAFDAFSNLQWLAYTERTRDRVDVQHLAGTLHTRTTAFTSKSWALHGIVDRIGAGDAFAAGILHGLIRTLPPQATVDFGTAAACLKHSIPGDFNLVAARDIEMLLSEARTDVRR